MGHERLPSIAAAAGLLIALGAVWGCEARSDPRLGFLEAWLEQRAPRLGGKARADVARALLAAETETGTDAFLLLAVVEEESRYDPSASSPRGARGLMQLRPETARGVASRSSVRWTGARDLDDPATNVRLGAVYLAEMKRQFGDWSIALSAYHNGPTKIRRIQRRGRKVPTGYASRVLRRQRQIHDAFDGRGQ
jgi:soluble lytic murein transglycosylase-like protein